jgi:hypothetical protein
LISYTNDDSENAYWRREIESAKNGNYVQIIDVSGHLCSASESIKSIEYIDARGQCQISSGARYTIRDSDLNAHPGHSVAGRYITTADNIGYNRGFSFSEFNVAHEVIHLKQNAHAGRRLYMEHPADGECCTLNFEHMAYVFYKEYTKKLPNRFEGISLGAPWNGWRIDEELQIAFKQGIAPSWWHVPFPDAMQSPEAVHQRWHIAAYIQSAYRVYTAFKNGSNYTNIALEDFTCLINDTCEQKQDPNIAWNNLTETQRALYSFNYGIVFDKTYRLKNLATTFFIHKANQNMPGGFGEYDFWIYELKNRRSHVWHNRDELKLGYSLSDKEMFALAGFKDRAEFLEVFHKWMVSNLENKRSPLNAADEIIRSHSEYVNDLYKLKTRNRISGGSTCADDLLPRFRLVCEEGNC